MGITEEMGFLEALIFEVYLRLMTQAKKNEVNQK